MDRCSNNDLNVTENHLYTKWITIIISWEKFCANKIFIRNQSNKMREKNNLFTLFFFLFHQPKLFNAKNIKPCHLYEREREKSICKIYHCHNFWSEQIFVTKKKPNTKNQTLYDYWPMYFAENYHGSNTGFLVAVLVSVVSGVFITFALVALCYRSVVIHKNISLCLRLVS
jgi:hypothetical protein